MKSSISFPEIEAGSFPRFSTSWYSIIRGTEIETENLPLGKSEINLYDAPRRDLKDENITFVSITIFMWYYISYHGKRVKINMLWEHEDGHEKMHFLS